MVINFNDGGEGADWDINPSFCGLNEIDLSNPSHTDSWSYSYYGDTIIINFSDVAGYEDIIEFYVEIIEPNRLVLFVYYVTYH